MYRNKVKHNNDGTTTIFIESMRKGWEGTHEAIIDTEDFYKHENLFKKRKLSLLACRTATYPYARINVLKVGGEYVNPSSGRRQERRLTLQLHHLILGKPPRGKQVDHKNHNGLDNRKQNIHFVDYSQNNANQRRPANNTSGYKGVNWHKGDKKWHAKIARERKYLGSFTCKHEAALAYNKTAFELWGAHALLNEVPEEYKNDVEVI